MPNRRGPHLRVARAQRSSPGLRGSILSRPPRWLVGIAAILTDQPASDVASLSVATALAPASRTTSATDKDTGLQNLPSRDFEHNQVWLALVLIAHDLICWTQRLLLTGELARVEPKRLRYRLLHVAARLAFHARTATLRLQATWPWARELASAFQRLKALPAPAG